MIPIDKLLHLLAGAVVLALTLPLGAMLAAAAVLAAALGKEAYDAWANAQAEAAGLPTPHTADGVDALATLLGGAAMLLGLQATSALAAWLGG